jgi:transcriptional regulator with XRE-family HTH domain|nr:MAG TPA: helix-turn-helix domain protein [Caudoviricetes sp.]
MVFTELRKEKHFTQQRLADALGVKQSTVAMWETNKSVPSMKNLLALSRLLEVSIDTICDSLKATDIKKE